MKKQIAREIQLAQQSGTSLEVDFWFSSHLGVLIMM